MASQELTIIPKKVNPDHAKGSATGAMNFLVFAMSALAAPALGWWLQDLSGGAAFTHATYAQAFSALAVGIVLAAILTLFLKETGSAVRKVQ